MNRADRTKLNAALSALGTAVGVKGCAPVRHGMDEKRCLTCGRVWSTQEDKPECERDSV